MYIFSFFCLTAVIRKVHFQHFYFLPDYLMKCNKKKRPEFALPDSKALAVLTIQ